MYTYRLFGYRFLYLFLHCIVFYYVLFSRSVKKSLAIFYKRADLPFGHKQYYRHLFQFAATILDRFVARIEPGQFTMTYENDAYLRELDSGAIILVSHVGGWSSVANLLQFENRVINIVIKEAYPEQIRELENSLERKNSHYVKVIDMNNGFESLIKIAEALGAGEIVAMMADRVFDEKNTIQVPFLGKPIWINEAPFDLAQRRKIPLFLLHTIRKSVREYHVTVSDPIDYHDPKKAAHAYITQLEAVVKRHPDHWFNFYDIWACPDTQHRREETSAGAAR